MHVIQPTPEFLALGTFRACSYGKKLPQLQARSRLIEKVV